MGKGGVMPVGCGRATSMGEAAARAEMAARRRVFVYIFGRVLRFGGFCEGCGLRRVLSNILLFEVAIE
jgi:hypothetical protein